MTAVEESIPAMWCCCQHLAPTALPVSRRRSQRMTVDLEICSRKAVLPATRVIGAEYLGAASTAKSLNSIGRDLLLAYGFSILIDIRCFYRKHSSEELTLA